MPATVLGLPSLRKKLKALPDAAKAEIQKAMEQAAQEIVDMAKGLVPVDDGDLRNSIGWTWGDPPRGAIVISRSRPLKNASDIRMTVFAGDDRAFYARWVEFGTAPHPNLGEFAGTRHPGTRAHPFFYPAYRVHRKRMKSKVSRAITKAAKKVAAGK